MFAPVAPLIACLKLQCSEVHVFLMCVMLCLRSCDCPEVKEGSRGRVQRRINCFAVLLLPTLQNQLSLSASTCTKPNLVPSCQHTKTWPQSHAVQGWDQCGWPRYRPPCLFVIGHSLLVGQPQFWRSRKGSCNSDLNLPLNAVHHATSDV